MKIIKILIFTAAFFSTINIFAQNYALPMVIGIQGGITQSEYHVQYEYDYMEGTEDITTDFFMLGIYFDAKYFRASFDYLASSGDSQNKYYYKFTAASNESGNENVSLDIQSLDFTLLGKYPFKIVNNFDIWPAAGLCYSHNIRAYDNDENEEIENRSMRNDIWFNIGIGADFRLTEVIIATTDFQVGGNLTPDQFDDDDVDIIDESSYRVQWKIGIGYKFGGGGY